MQIIPLLLKELDQEAVTTRKMLALVPNDKYDWKPHEKSMSMIQLATHIVELPSWITMGFNTTELDFASAPYNPTAINNTSELLDLFEKSYESGKSSLSAATEEDLLPNWTLRTGEHIHGVYTKYELIRHSFSQTSHHRAQLGVYLRLLNIPIPGSYGPSADDMNF
ncbi:MAG: DinB family protein [Chitinophagaceae bacterium]